MLMAIVILYAFIACVSFVFQDDIAEDPLLSNALSVIDMSILSIFFLEMVSATVFSLSVFASLLALDKFAKKT